MKTTIWTLSFLAAVFLIVPVSCKKDKNATPNNQGQNNNNNNNNGNGGQGQNSNNTIYFRGTVNGTKAEWGNSTLSYRLITRGGGTEGACDNDKERISAGFALETYSGVEQFYMSLTNCSDLDVLDPYFGNCDKALGWLERETTFPIRATEEVSGAHIKFKLPANGKTYITAGTSGTVKLTKVEQSGIGTYGDPRYTVTGTFDGSLANLNDPLDQIEIKDGTFRIYIGFCAQY